MVENKFRVRLDTPVLAPAHKERRDYLTAIVLVVIQMVILVIAHYLRWLPREVPLYLSRPWGEGRLAPSSHLLVLPLIAGCVIIINLLLSRLVKDESLLVTTLSTATLVTTLMLTLAMGGILQSIL